MGAVSRYNVSTRPRSYTERESLRRSEALGVKLERIDGSCGAAHQSWVASAPGNKFSSLARRSVRHLSLDGGMARGATRGFEARRRPRTSTTSVKAVVHQREYLFIGPSARAGFEIGPCRQDAIHLGVAPSSDIWVLLIQSQFHIFSAGPFRLLSMTICSTRRTARSS